MIENDQKFRNPLPVAALFDRAAALFRGESVPPIAETAKAIAEEIAALHEEQERKAGEGRKNG